MTCASWSGPSRCLTLIRALSAIGPMGSTHPSLYFHLTIIKNMISVSFLSFQQLWQCLFISANVPAMKAWLLYSNTAGTQQVTCRNKNENMRTFGMAETDFSSCVEFCELHVDSSGHICLLLDLKNKTKNNCEIIQLRCSAKTAKAVCPLQRLLRAQLQLQRQRFRTGAQLHRQRRQKEGSWRKSYNL